MSRILRLWLAVLLIVPVLAACSSQGSNLPPLSAAGAKPDENSYRLGPGDKLNIKVLGSEDLSGDYSVSDGGTVGMPLIGEVKAAGLTRAQLERQLVDKLSQGYLRNPRVSVAVLTYRPFSILGEVTKPGQYPYASGMRVLNAVAAAGGYSYRANEDYVIVTRDGKDHKASVNAPIEPDDIIRVPERFF